MLRTVKKTIRLYDMKCRETVIRSAGSDGPYQKFIIPEIDPWQAGLILNE